MNNITSLYVQRSVSVSIWHAPTGLQTHYTGTDRQVKNWNRLHYLGGDTISDCLNSPRD